MTDGLIVTPGAADAATTLANIVTALGAHELTLIARVDHAAAASRAGLALGPTELLIFGNPRGGTPLMQVARTIAIDLPLRMLVWTDDGGATWTAYDDPRWLARRHGITEDHPAIARIGAALDEIARAAARPVSEGE